MTPGSERYRGEILAICNRFQAAVSASFSFLLTFGYSACPPDAADLDDLRDARLTLRYIKERSALDITLSILTRQTGVVLFAYSTPPTCQGAQRFEQATELEDWIKRHQPTLPGKLPWMKKATLAEEMGRSYNTFIRQMDLHMEEVVDWLAVRLKLSGMLSA